MSRIVELAASSAIAISDSVGCSITRGATGRTTRFFTTEQIDDERLAKQWSSVPDLEGLLVHPGAMRFNELMAKNQSTLTGIVRAYRGRLRSTLPDDPDVRDFGPPPEPFARQGRYNNQGQSVLYLATSPDGVRVECPTDSDDDGVLCREFLVDIGSLRIFDASSESLPDFLHIAWDEAERQELPEYLFSRALAELVRRQGYDGMVVPGTRGCPSNRYRNIVFFNPGRIWEHWISDSSPLSLE